MISPHHKRIGEIPKGNSHTKPKPQSPNLVDNLPTKDKPLPPGVRNSALRTQTNPIIKDEVYIEKYGAETGGAYARFCVKVAPGGGVPLHYHHSYAEHFLAQAGDLSIVVGEEIKILQPGEQASVPIGTKHRFFNASTDTDVEFVAELRPAHEGFEKSLHIIYGLARDGEVGLDGMPKGLVAQCLVADMGDMSLVGWTMSMARPVLKAIAAYGRWTGEEERLLRKYWY